MLRGIAASPGIEIGKAYVLKENRVIIDKSGISEEKVEEQEKRLEEAVDLSRTQLKSIKAKAEREMGKEKAAIFDAQLMALEDQVFLDEVRSKIKDDKITAEYAVSQITENYVETFKNVEDEYLRERAADIKDVGQRLIKNILGVPIETLADISERVIVVAKDLTPSDTAQMNKEMVLAFATDLGGRTSHTAIMARSLGISAVVGLAHAYSKVRDNDTVIVDGNKGVVYINPGEHKLKEYQKLREDYIKYCRELRELKTLPGQTRDRIRTVELSANIGTSKEVKNALDSGAEGVGLYRTEFLYMDREALPTEEEQFQAYKTVAESMAPRPVTVRTLDIGGDKKLPYLDMPDEQNPFLGWRAIRMCLDRPNILKTQLRAILRASHYGKLRIMYPMVSKTEEIRKANAVLQETRRELKSDGIPFDEKLQVGIMVEIPSAAVTADTMIKYVDFFSIGTNDLIQYTLAVDRTNEHISDLYEPFHPAVLRLIKNVIDASHKTGKWTGMCGEMAGDTLAAPILLGMGLDEFSMSASSIPEVKKVIRSFTYEEAKWIADTALNMEEPKEIKQMVEKVVEKLR